jgi:hypothetical protein
MANLKSISNVAQITNTGALGIIDKGFCYSTTDTSPSIGAPNCTQWSSSVSIDPNGVFTDTITGLTQSTKYWINSYAINSLGTSYSIGSTQSVTTTGISTYPTITVYIKKLVGLDNQRSFEIGTSTNLTVSGETVKNDENIFISGHEDQILPTFVDNVSQWTGYQATYTNTKPVNFYPKSFSNTYIEPTAWTMKHTAYQTCGDPQYIITATTTVDGVFPFLWVIKNQFYPLPSTVPNYFDPGNNTPNNYFYKDASTPSLTSGKLVESKGTKSFVMQPSGANVCLSLGFPYYYYNGAGSVECSLDGTNWFQPSNMIVRNVNTGWYSYNLGIYSSWNFSYNIIQYTFAETGKALTFMIKFI